MQASALRHVLTVTTMSAAAVAVLGLSAILLGTAVASAARDAQQELRALLDEAAGRWDGERILLVGCHAAYVALEHLANGAVIAEAVARPRPWQPGWTYSYDEHDRHA